MIKLSHIIITYFNNHNNLFLIIKKSLKNITYILHQ